MQHPTDPFAALALDLGDLGTAGDRLKFEVLDAHDLLKSGVVDLADVAGRLPFDPTLPADVAAVLEDVFPADAAGLAPDAFAVWTTAVAYVIESARIGAWVESLEDEPDVAV